MVHRRLPLSTLCTAFGLLAAGCVSPVEWGPSSTTMASSPADKSTVPAVAAPAGSLPAAGKRDVGANPAATLSLPGMPGNSAGVAGAAVTPTSTLSGGRVLEALRKGKDSLVSATRVEPTVIPPADPVRLDNQPANREAVAADLHYHAGRVFETQENWPAAAAHYRDGLKLLPQDVRLLAACARMEDKQGNDHEAESLYRKAIELAPKEASVYNDLALYYSRRGQRDQAVRLLSQAIQFAPHNKLYRNNLASVLVDSGRTEEALQHLVMAHGGPIGHYNLGILLWERNAKDVATVHFRRAIELNPQLVEARRMLGEVVPASAIAASPPPGAAPYSAARQAAGRPPTTRLPSVDSHTSAPSPWVSAMR